MYKENNGLDRKRLEHKLYAVENIDFLRKGIVIDAYPAHLEKKKRTMMDYRSVVISYEKIESIINQIAMRKNKKGEQHEM